MPLNIYIRSLLFAQLVSGLWSSPTVELRRSAARRLVQSADNKRLVVMPILIQRSLARGAGGWISDASFRILLRENTSAGK